MGGGGGSPFTLWSIREVKGEADDAEELPVYQVLERSLMEK